MIFRGSTIPAPLEVRAQVVVVGSGAGGALVAKRLAEAGRDVVLVEAGPYVTAGDMTQTEREMMPRLYWDAGLRQTEDGSMAVLHGRAVGGSTLVNYLDCFRTPDRLLERWVDERGLPELAPARMRPRFERIEEVMHVRKIDDTMLNENNRKLKIGGERMGWKGDHFHRNALDCYGSGFCDLGCAYNAKQSAAITWVPLALRHGARLYCECRVERVLLEAGRAIGVEGTLLDDARQPRGAARILADVVVVSGGAIETPHLLLRSGTPDPSGQLGHNLFLHPGAAVVGRFPGEHVAHYAGIKQGYYVSEFSWPLEGHPDDFLLEGIGAPPGITSTLVPGWGAERQAQFAHFNEFAAVGVLLRDHDPGRVEVGPGRPKVHYALSAGDATRMRAGIARGAEAFLAAGADVAIAGVTPLLEMRTPQDVGAIWHRGLGAGEIGLFCFHQMGSCRMGSRRDRDVVDPSGRAWAVPNLYVADASLFPTASGVNPQMTVYGLCDVVADGILSA